VTERNIPAPTALGGERRPQPGARKRYETPRLIDYGRISKLTETGGITTKDQGNMERRGP
jgi:hypothetical protein